MIARVAGLLMDVRGLVRRRVAAAIEVVAHCESLLLRKLLLLGVTDEVLVVVKLGQLLFQRLAVFKHPLRLRRVRLISQLLDVDDAGLFFDGFFLAEKTLDV